MSSRGMCLGGCLLLLAMLSGCATGTAPLTESEESRIARDAEQALSSRHGVNIPYRTDIAVDGTSAGELRSAMEKASQLVSLDDEVPDSRVTLERRAIADVQTARDLMESRGYFDGQASYSIDWNASPVAVVLSLVPGVLYHVGTSSVALVDAEPRSSRAQKILAKAPDSLQPFGLENGAPAVAADVTAAVDVLPDWFRRRGFPAARVDRARYRLYPSREELDPLIHVKTGPFALFGPLEVHGATTVKASYLEQLQPWKEGDLWNTNRVAAYRETLMQSGLFREVRVKPGFVRTEDGHLLGTKDDRVPVRLDVREGTARRTGMGLRYASDVGFGAQGYWEHRNLFGSGERLKGIGIFSQERQELALSFVKPVFFAKNQNLVSSAYARKEDTDAYELETWYMDGGIERKLSRRWVASARVAMQAGRIKEDIPEWESFTLFGIPLSLRYEGTDNILNPTRGTRLQLSMTPYIGSYRGSFSMVRTQADFSAYFAPLHKKDGSRSDRLVLAARAVVGGMFGSMGRDVEHIPGALRFYAGGGGSVRGYKYQTIGPRNRKGDPLGGLSFNVLNLEARFKVTDTIGIVPFVDAGMVYDRAIPEFGKDLCWSAGIGLRYFTPIGPVRLDVSTPLDDRNDDQKAFQVYISIGQAF